MVVLWQWSELCDALNLARRAGPDVNGINIDSRNVKAGQLFVAISGRARPEFNINESSGRDGHSYIDAALAQGAVGILVHDEHIRDVSTLQCNETLAGLWQLGRYRRQQLKCPVVAVTGSSGKTTLKSFLCDALNAFASDGSLNNHLGVPLSLANTPRNATSVVYEIGTNHPGEIRRLSDLVKPGVALLLNVHPAHIGNFRDLAELTIEKLSIATGMERGGTLIVPTELANHVYIRNAAFNLVTHGKQSDSDVRYRVLNPLNVEIQNKNDSIVLEIPGGGEHRAATLCAAAATLTVLGLPLRALTQIREELPPGRGNMTRVSNMQLIDESYNANPASMSEAILAFSLSDAQRKIAIIGTMNELGDASEQFHLALLPLLSKLDKVICVGAYMNQVFEQLPRDVRWLHSQRASDELIQTCVNELRSGDSVLIKGSNSVFWQCDFVDNLIHALRSNQ